MKSTCLVRGPDPDWAGAFAGAFGTVRNLIEADVFCPELD